MQPSKRSLVVGFHLIALLAAGCSQDTTEHTDAGASPSNGGQHGGNQGGNAGGHDGGAAAGGLAKLGDHVAGQACVTNADCQGENATCGNSVGGVLGFGGAAAPGGYCTGSCNTSGDCGAGGACVNLVAGFVQGQGTCQEACTTDADCTRSGYVCASNVGLGTQPKTCQPKPATVQLADGVVGGACSTNQDCGAGTCAATLGGFSFLGQTGGGTQASGGYCTGACTQNADCGANGLCVKGFSLSNQAGSCYLACGSHCNRDGYACGRVGFGGGGGGGFGGFGGGGAQTPQQACLPVRPQPDAGMGMEPDAGHTGHLDAGYGEPDSSTTLDAAHDMGDSGSRADVSHAPDAGADGGI